MSEILSWAPAAPVPSSRRAAASVLRWASLQLARAARALARPSTPRLRYHIVEFHAEAGAPEGALYVDGELVGHLPGVTRL